MNKIYQKKIIMFVAPALTIGGAERVLVNIIKNIDYSKYEIYLILFEKKGDLIDSLPQTIQVLDLKKRGYRSFFRIIYLLAKTYRNIAPDLVISFLSSTNLVSVLAKIICLKKIKVVVSFRNYLSKELKNQRFGMTKHLLYIIFIRYADMILINSQIAKTDILTTLGLSDSKVKVIYNPININEINNKNNEDIKQDIPEKYILAVGRLVEAKGHQYLIKAYSLIHYKIEEKLIIIGDGVKKDVLKKMAYSLGLQNKVIFLGEKNNPYTYMKKATIFVLSSIYEGFPNVLLEAMACGVPIVSTDCTSGPREIISNGKDGILVPPANALKLAQAIFDLISNAELRIIYSKAGMEKVHNFSIEKIMLQYEKIFQENFIESPF